MAMYKLEILLPHGNKKRMAEDLGYSEQTIKLACRYITNSETAIRIRKEAIERYDGKLSKIRI